MIDTSALREKVLDLAIRGKLVPQDPNDEPASVLLERIRAEKEQMVKDGKLKAKDIKNDTVIFKGEDNLHYEKFADGTLKCIEDEIPFDVPDGWAWTRIGNISSVRGGKRIPKGMSFSSETTNHAYIRVTDMKNHTVNMSELKYIDEDVFAQIKNYIVSKNDLYITIAGTIGAVGEIPDELEGMNLTENAVRVTDIQINKSFLCLMMQSDFVQKQFKYKTYQVAMPKLGLERILTTLIPVCNFTTQQKICDEINQVDKLLNLLDSEYGDLKSIVTVIKSKILNLAICGKLVPQDPNDEPASVLLERIKAEKEELIKQGKIKRDKKESVIFKGGDNSYYENIGSEIKDITDEIPFDIPDSWLWTRLSSIMEIKSGNTYPAAYEKECGEKLYVKVGDMNIPENDFEILTSSRYIDNFKEEHLICPPSIIFPKRGGAIATNKKKLVLKDSILIDLNTMGITPYKGVEIMYLYYWFQNVDLSKLYNGTSIPQINNKDIMPLLIPVPSLTEQKEICKKISALYAEVREIEKSLN